MQIKKKSEKEENQTYSYEQMQKEIEKAITEKKSEWEKGLEERLAAERDEATRLATMSADERSRLEFD